MSYKNILAAASEHLATIKEQEAQQEADRIAARQDEQEIHNRKAINAAERTIHQELIEFLSVTSSPGEYGYSYILDIPECTPIKFALRCTMTSLFPAHHKFYPAKMVRLSMKDQAKISKTLICAWHTLMRIGS